MSEPKKVTLMSMQSTLKACKKKSNQSNQPIQETDKKRVADELLERDGLTLREAIEIVKTVFPSWRSTWVSHGDEARYVRLLAEKANKETINLKVLFNNLYDIQKTTGSTYVMPISEIVRRHIEIEGQKKGLPGCYAAYLDAIRKPFFSVVSDYCHPVVAITAYQVGRKDLRERTEKEMFTHFEKAYLKNVVKVLKGETLEVPDNLKPKERSASKTTPKETALRILQKIKKDQFYQAPEAAISGG